MLGVRPVRRLSVFPREYGQWSGSAGPAMGQIKLLADIAGLRKTDSEAVAL
jgi:hypothetical protein